MENLILCVCVCVRACACAYVCVCVQACRHYFLVIVCASQWRMPLDVQIRDSSPVSASDCRTAMFICIIFKIIFFKVTRLLPRQSSCNAHWLSKSTFILIALRLHSIRYLDKNANNEPNFFMFPGRSRSIIATRVIDNNNRGLLKWRGYFL